jgi:hypothetical protein
MEMKRCDKGHFYDSERTMSCPYCGNDMGSGMNVTRPLGLDVNNISETRALSGENGNIPKTRPMDSSAPIKPGSGDDGKTVAIIKPAIGVDPVVGWLVCIEGGDKGRDYRIHAERNFIGRSEHMGICIRGDETISRDAHAILSYDMRKNVFRIYQGESKGIVYLNDEEVITAEQLKPYDIIELGKTKLVFIPLCGERFKWE